MRMPSVLLVAALLIICLLLTGSTIRYAQAIDSSGKSTISETSDLGAYLQTYPQGALTSIRDACSLNPSLGCSVSGTEITITAGVVADSGYYSFATEYGMPFTTTTLTVDKIPRDVFDSSLNRILSAAGLTSSKGSAKPIDLRDKARNALLADAWSQSGLQMNYAITMPNGYSQGFDIITLMADSKPITIQTQEPNWGLIVLVLGVLVLAGFALSFFKGKKKSGKR